MFDDMSPIDQEYSDPTNTETLDNNAAWAQSSESGLVTRISEPHFHTDHDGYGYDTYTYDTSGEEVDRQDGHQLDPSGQRSLQDYDVDQQPLISGKLNQQTQNQFGSVDGTQRDLNGF